MKQRSFPLILGSEKFTIWIQGVGLHCKDAVRHTI